MADFFYPTLETTIGKSGTNAKSTPSDTIPTDKSYPKRTHASVVRIQPSWA